MVEEWQGRTNKCQEWCNSTFRRYIFSPSFMLLNTSLINHQLNKTFDSCERHVHFQTAGERCHDVPSYLPLRHAR